MSCSEGSRVYLNHPPSDRAMVKVDFQNALLLRSVVSRITNTDFEHGDSRLQATLPVNSGGLVFRSASILAPSAFLASANGASDLMQHLLPNHLPSLTYPKRDQALSIWKSFLPRTHPSLRLQIDRNLGISH